MDLLGLDIIYWTIIILVVIIVIVAVLVSSPKTIKYYPVVNIGANSIYNNGITVPQANDGIAAVSVNTASLNVVPAGFTFLNAWSFNSNIGSTGQDALLSNNNQTLTVSNGAQNQGIAVGNTELSGKVMYSVTMKYPGYTNEFNGVGVATSGFNAVSMSSNQGFAGYDSKAFVIFDNGIAYINNAKVNTVAYGNLFENINGNNIIDVCVDTVNLLIWYRVDNGSWNINGNPSAGIGGISMSGLN